MSIHEIEEGLPHNTAHTICLRCIKTEVTVWPEGTKMSDLICGQCGKKGGVVPSCDPLFKCEED